MKYYIQNRDSGFLGNSIIFWAQNSNGYTAKLEKAHQYTYEEAQAICQGDPSKNKAWAVDYIDNNIGTARVTDDQYLDKENIIDFGKKEECYKTKKQCSHSCKGLCRDAV
jgi:hypothetical protein